MRALVVLAIGIAVAVTVGSHQSAQPTLRVTPVEAYNVACLQNLSSGCPLIR